MKKYIATFLGTLLISNLLWAESPSAEEILTKIDANNKSKSLSITASMIIHGTRGKRTLKSKSLLEGDKKAATTYLSPARDKGTKMLKIDDKLWIYYPRADRVIKMAGHLLRQSVMGSDLSYEDFMEENTFAGSYQATIKGEETLFDRPVYILDLQAKNKDVTYQKQKLWVDRERFVILKSEQYALSGRLLKKMEAREVKKIKERWYTVKLWFKDVLKKGKGTEYHIHDIAFDVDIPARKFSKSFLRK